MEETQRFAITNDQTAEWALRKIKEARQERDRIVSLAQSEIERLTGIIKSATDTCDRDTAYFQDELRRYFETVTPKETKTKASYKLLSGTLIYKKPTIQMEPDKDKLIERLRGTEYVKTSETFAWGEYKKRLAVADGIVVDTQTGEALEDVTASEKPGEFEVEVIDE